MRFVGMELIDNSDLYGWYHDNQTEEAQTEQRTEEE